jgi:ribonuclease PH
VTAEYGADPQTPTCAPSGRACQRAPVRGCQEIQRLIGVLRALPSSPPWVSAPSGRLRRDQADGGTRTASITGGFVALGAGLQAHEGERPAVQAADGLVAATSVGVLEGRPV